ncbi:hypothetical protein EGR_01518 [Echinococcus granulosus]|uniref:Uncharacterized protein n=1 Tax=Echinococcus granulosus TaxID=6210 RepID=W6US01_ECHGR|nr:hypothetical protein EGR_01518 [Echinococcus granulosus]EUB63436.1 hypothetical protein EGR_01518 [Echinococcus granulosus]
MSVAIPAYLACRLNLITVVAAANASRRPIVVLDLGVV